MGICCCKRSEVAGRPSLTDNSAPLNPLHGPPFLSAVPHGSVKDGSGAFGLGEGGLTDYDGTLIFSNAVAKDGTDQRRHDGSSSSVASSLSSASARISKHRRHAVCGETLSDYLRDIKWWTSAYPPSTADSSATVREELEVVRAVLQTHPLFRSCAEDAALMDEMLRTFERHEVAPGARIVDPGDMTAFHVVVRGKAVAALLSAKDDGMNGGSDGEASPETTAQTGEEGGAMGEAAQHTAVNKPPCTAWQVGDAFGHEGLLYPLPGSYEGASVRAATTDECDAASTVTWRLSRLRYQQLLRLHNDAQLRRLVRMLSQCPLFEHLSPQLLLLIGERAELVTHARAAGPLLSVGDAPTHLTVLGAGTVAVEHRRLKGYSGPAYLQAALLGPGDCIGDEEWLGALPDDSCVPPDHIAPAAYTYTPQETVEGVRLRFEDLCALLSPAELAAMKRASRNIRESGARREAVQAGVRALVEQSLLPPSGEDNEDSSRSGTDSDGDESYATTQQQTGRDALAAPVARDSARPPPPPPPPLSEDVTVKSVDVTNFLLEHFFTRPTYSGADGRERGLSMAAFTARRHYPCGTVLFDVTYETRKDGSVSRLTEQMAARDSGATAMETEDGAPIARKADRLYAIASGEVSVMDAVTEAVIFTVVRGGSVGEEGLLPPLRCSAATPLHTRTVVTSAGGCDVYELSARGFHKYLRRPYTAGIRRFCAVFCVLPYAEYFPESHWRFLAHSVKEKEVVGGDLVAVCGAPCVYVALLLDGQVAAYADGVPERADGTVTGRRVASFGRGDIIAGQEAATGKALAVAYVCEGRTRMLCVPAASFSGLFRLAAGYLHTLWSQERYRAVVQH